MRVLQPIQDDLNFHHENGEIYKVTVEIAGVRTRRVRVSTLITPAVTEAQITNVISTYGDVKKIHDEVWSHAYRFKVKTGVRLVDIGLKKHIPSHIKIDGHRALIWGTAFYMLSMKWAGPPNNMIARVGNCQEVNKPAMTGIHGQIWPTWYRESSIGHQQWHQ